MSLVQEALRPEQRSKASVAGWQRKMGENLHVFVNPLTFQARPKASATPR